MVVKILLFRVSLRSGILHLHNESLFVSSKERMGMSVNTCMHIDQLIHGVRASKKKMNQPFS